MYVFTILILQSRPISNLNNIYKILEQPFMAGLQPQTVFFPNSNQLQYRFFILWKHPCFTHWTSL